MAKRAVTKRITLDLSEQFHDRIENLQDLVGANTKAGVIRQALQLYEYLARRTARGDKFQAVDKSGETESIVFLDLQPPV